MRCTRSFTASLALLLCSACTRVPNERAPLRIAAASDLQFVMEALLPEFRRLHSAGAQVSYGSSGNFYAQIRNGAPYDIFLSADAEYPRRLLSDGAGVKESLFLYGVGRIVVWVRNGAPLDPATALQDERMRRLAIANPAHAPYGRAAEAALRSMNLSEALRAKLVIGENIAQAFGFVRSGAADAGIVALSLALSPAARNEGRYWEIPQQLYPRLEQAGLILKDSPGARAFRSFLTSSEGRMILRQYGFGIPEDN